MSLKYDKALVRQELETYSKERPDADAETLEKKRHELICREALISVWSEHHARFETDGKDIKTYEAELRGSLNAADRESVDQSLYPTQFGKLMEYFTSKDSATAQRYLEFIQKVSAADNTGAYFTRLMKNDYLSLHNTLLDPVTPMQTLGDAYVRGMFAPIPDSTGMRFQGVQGEKDLRQAQLETDSIHLDVPEDMNPSLLTYAVMGEFLQPERLNKVDKKKLFEGSTLPEQVSSSEHIRSGFVENTIVDDDRLNMQYCRILMPEVRRTVQQQMNAHDRDTMLRNVSESFNFLYGISLNFSRGVGSQKYAFCVRHALKAAQAAKEAGIDPATLGMTQEKLARLNFMQKLVDFQAETLKMRKELNAAAEEYYFSGFSEDRDPSQQPELREKLQEITARNLLIKELAADVNTHDLMYSLVSEAGNVSDKMALRPYSPLEKQFRDDPAGMLTRYKEMVHQPQPQKFFQEALERPASRFSSFMSGISVSSNAPMLIPLSDYLGNTQAEFFAKMEDYLQRQPQPQDERTRKALEDMREAFSQVREAAEGVQPNSDWRTVSRLLAPYRRLEQTASNYFDMLPEEKLSHSTEHMESPGAMQGLRAVVKALEARHLSVPENLETSNKLLFDALAETAEQSGFMRAFGALSDLSSQQLTQKLQEDLQSVADANDQAKYREFFKIGISSVKLINSMKTQNELRSKDLDTLRKNLKTLDEAAGFLRGDSYEMLNDYGYKALKPDSQHMLRSLMECSQACCTLSTILPLKLQEHAFREAVADQDSYYTQNNHNTRKRLDLHNVLESPSNQALQDEHDALSGAFELGLDIQETLESRNSPDVYSLVQRELNDIEDEYEETEMLKTNSAKNPYLRLNNLRSLRSYITEPDSVFLLNDKEQFFAERDVYYSRLLEEASELESQIDNERDEIEAKKVAAEERLKELPQDTPENEKAQLNKEIAEYKKLETRLTHKFLNQIDKWSNLNGKRRDLRDALGNKEKQHLEKINAVLKKNGLKEQDALPTAQKLDALIREAEKKAEKDIEELRNQRGFVEDQYARPEKYLKELSAREDMLQSIDTSNKEAALKSLDENLQSNQETRKSYVQAAKDYNSLCQTSTAHRAAFEKARFSAGIAEKYQPDAQNELRGELRRISEHLNDKKRFLHWDSGEFTAMQTALNDIANGSEPITDEKLKTLQDAAGNYISAKGDLGSSPSEMRIVRLNAAKEITALTSLHQTLNANIKTAQSATKRFLAATGKMNIAPTPDLYDRKNSLANRLSERNRQLESMNPVWQVGKQKSAELLAPEKSEPVKDAIALGGLGK